MGVHVALATSFLIYKPSERRSNPNETGTLAPSSKGRPQIIFSCNGDGVHSASTAFLEYEPEILQSRERRKGQYLGSESTR